MTLNEIIRARRSVRKYQDRQVDRALVEQVLEAGRLAPSARNAQNWRFTVVEDETLRARLQEACCGQEMVREAPAALVLWSLDARQMTNGQSAATVDCSIALSFMILKAAELGLGTCWLGAYRADQVRAVLDLPEDAIVVAVSPLGWPAEAPEARSRKPIEEIADYR